MMVPTKAVLVPNVAEVPTCQKTLQGLAPLARTILESVAVIRVDVIWKIQTVSASPWASSVRVPVSPIVGLLYIPPINV